MSNKFQIQYRNSSGNLHIDPKGDLDGSSAFQITNLIRRKYDGKGRVFINTENIKEIYSFGKSVFQGQLDFKTLPAERLFFKGKKGLDMAPNGSRGLFPEETINTNAAKIAQTALARPGTKNPRNVISCNAHRIGTL